MTHPDNSPSSVRVLVVDDEAPLRAAISDLVSGEPGLEVVGSAADVDEAVTLAERTKPDVALVDVKLPGGGGPAAVRGIHDVSPQTHVIALSAYEDRATVFEMLGTGVVGYLVKGIAPVEIVDAIDRAMRGQASLPTDLIRRLMQELVKDIEERRRTEDVLRRSEERFRSLLESSPDATVIIDAQGSIVIVNRVMEELFGYTRDELIGSPIELLLPSRFHERHVSHRATYFADPQTRPMGAGLELAGRRRDGTEFPVDISLSAVDTDEGRLVTARVRDITERQADELIRRRSEERFASLLESAPDGVVIIDAEGTVVLVNHQTEVLFGYERDEILGRPVETLLPERVRDRHVSHRAGYLDEPLTRPMGADLELAGRRKDGSEFPVDISLSTIDTPEGKLLTSFVRDITDRVEHAELERQAEERRALLARFVETSEEERQRIAGDIHDDSIQAITAAGMRLQILRRSLTDPDHLQLLAELEETIQLSINRLRHLLFDLRPPSLDKDGLGPALALYLDQTVIGETVYRLDDRLLTQPGPETRVILYRIAQEAITNVRKHAHAVSAIVTLEERDGGYAMRVTDDGVGFEPSTNAPVPGHLGLVAMRERAALAGGTLNVQAQPGRGAIVSCWIPVAKD